MRRAALEMPAEQALLRPVLRGLIRLRWASQMSPAAAEVPWHEKRIDLVVAPTGGLTLAFELKVSDWGRAISQAYVNRWVADQSWVVVWHSRVTPRSADAAQDAGVGLMIVTRDTVYPLVRPDAPVASLPAAGPIHDVLAIRRTRMRDLLGSL